MITTTQLLLMTGNANDINRIAIEQHPIRLDTFWQVDTEPLGSHSMAIFATSITNIITVDFGQLGNFPGNPGSIFTAL